jgi:Tol biopolymer transport system component/DNA-binding winged helix-turn-helix (wHTH) protein
MSHTSEIYRFGDFSLDTHRRLLLRRTDPVPLTPKAFDTLTLLVRRNGEVVQKDELLKAIWPDTFVEEATLAQNVFTLRKALGHGKTGNYIETVPKHGYRFVAPVTSSQPDDGVLHPPTPTRHVIDEKVDEPTTTGQSARGFRLGPALLTAILSLGLALAAAIYIGITRQKIAATRAFDYQKFQGRKLTSHGQVVRSAISPDGKYVAYSKRDKERDGIWVRQVTSASELPVVASENARIRGIAFSPDSSFIYYTMYAEDNQVGALWRVPVLGGTPREMLKDIDSSISFSPEGSRVTFFRNTPAARESSLMLADLDGGNRMQLGAFTQIFTGEGPVWSPDGRVIIFPMRSGDPNRTKTILMAYSFDTNSHQPLAVREWEFIGQVTWAQDGTKLLLDAWDDSTGFFSPQLWEVSYPQGVAKRITNDLNSYAGVSLPSSDDLLVTTQSVRVAGFWRMSTDDAQSLKQISSGLGDKGGEVLGISWGYDHQIVYGSTAEGGIDLWTMDEQGQNQKQLTSDPAPDFKPSVSLTNGEIVFVSRRTGSPHLWLMKADGANPTQLTYGNTESYPSMSPDGGWVAYNSIEQSGASLWRLNLKTRAQVRLTEQSGLFPSVSPDGKLIACFYVDPVGSAPTLALIRPDDGSIFKRLEIPMTTFAFAGLRWTPDGRAVTYVNSIQGVGNVWMQPLDGSQPRPVTHFDSGEIYRFAWSPHGAELVVERGKTLRDIVLMKSDDG